MLTAAIGGERPNGIRSKPMSAAATEAQRRAYEASHIENPTTGQSVHIAAAIAHLQKIAKDATPGAGRTRYVTGERQPIISEDGEGTGFACEAYYELHMTEAGLPLNSRSEIILDGVLSVGYARVLELRKLNGRKMVPRISVRAAHASRCSAVVVPLVRQPDGRWAEDFSRASPQLVPVLSLGRRMVATRAAHGSLTFAVAGAAAGGAALREVALSADMFRKGEASGLQVDLMDMKVPQLKDELEARGETKTGCKPWLRRRLHAAIVRAHIAAVAEEDGGV